jgi:hypothetical protein
LKTYTSVFDLNTSFADYFKQRGISVSLTVLSPGDKMVCSDVVSELTPPDLFALLEEGLKNYGAR